MIAASTGLLAPAVGSPDWSSAQAMAVQLEAFRHAGFSHVDISDIWFDIPDLDDRQIALLTDAMTESGLTLAGASVVGVIVDQPAALEQSRRRALDGVANAIAFGSPVISVGLHNAPSRTAPKTPDPRLPWLEMSGPTVARDEHFEAAAVILAEACDLAAESGAQLSLELNEMSLLTSSWNCLRLLELTDRDNLGINPDLGSLVRVPWSLGESWQDTLSGIADHVNYWHVKNCHRIPLGGGRFASTPSTLAQGTIDYREAFRIVDNTAVPIVIEHYGGDVLWYAEEGLTYLNSI